MLSKDIEPAGAGRITIESALIDGFQCGTAFQHFKTVSWNQ